MLGWGYTTKQAKVIFKAWKQGKINMEKQVIDKIFKMADGNNHGCKQGMSMGRSINHAVDEIFAKRYFSAQFSIDCFASAIEPYERTVEFNRQGTEYLKSIQAANA